MPHIKVAQFRGLRPSVSGQNLPGNVGVTAHNCILRNGQIKPVRAPSLVRDYGYKVKSIYKIPDGPDGCGNLLALDYCASILPAAEAGCTGINHVVIFPTEGEPQRYIPDKGQYYPLVVPAPSLQLSLSKVSPGQATTPDERVYTYTWVDQFGVESPPAPPSVSVTAYDGDTWRLSGFSPAPANAVCVRIYRTGAVFSDGRNIGGAIDTSFQLVEEVRLPLLGNIYLDSRRHLDMDYGTLMTQDNCPPPENMCQVIYLESGYYVGFSGNNLHISSRHSPEVFKDRYSLTLDDKIVAITGYYEYIFVATTGAPYRIQVMDSPDDNDEMRIVDFKYHDNLPCPVAHTLVTTSFGALYCTHKGIVELSPQGQARLATKSIVDEQDFAANYMGNLAAWYHGRYYLIKNPIGTACVYDMPDPLSNDVDLGELTTTDLPASAVHVGHDGMMYYASGNAVYLWENGNSYLTFTWKSKEFYTEEAINFAAGRIGAKYIGPISFKLYSGTKLLGQAAPSKDAAFRLKFSPRVVYFSIEISGTSSIDYVKIATSITELTRTGDGQS